jgi:hypothetical protein
MISTGESCFRRTSLANSEADKRVISLMEEQMLGVRSGIRAISGEQGSGGMT